MRFPFKTLPKMAGCSLLYLAVFDILGVIVCFFLDLLSFGESNTLEYYTLWIVLGLICGLLSYDAAGRVALPNSATGGTTPAAAQADWSVREDAGKTGLLVILTTVLVLVGLSLLFSWLWWRQGGMEPSGFVPDSAPLTLTFFAAVVAAMIFAHTSLRTPPKKTT